MQLNDIGRRIFGEHSRLIAALVVGGLVVGLLLQVTSERMYTASARLVLDTADPKSQSESTSIADTGKALATSPAQVVEDLTAAIKRLSQDADLRHQFAEGGRNRVREEFTWARKAEFMRQTYRGLVPAKAPLAAKL